jgi:hypothetical protein
MDILRRIADAKGHCVTIVEPAGSKGNLDEAITEVEQGLPAAKRAQFVSTLRENLKKVNGADKGSVVMLCSEDLNELVLTDEILPTVRTVADSFELRALLPAFQKVHDFYLLALSRNRTRLVHCTATSSEEVPFAKGTPVSLGDSRNTDKPDHMLDNRSSAGPSQGSMKGVMSGTGTELEDKPEFTYTFFCEIDKAVHAVIKDSGLPLILVGVESELAIYRKANTYPLLGETGVLGSPDGFKGGEMHARGLRALTTYVPPAMQKTLDELDKLIGTGHASVHASDIVKAAHEGRVSHLFLQSGAEYLGNFDENRGKTSHHVASGEQRHDLMEDAVRQTVLHGGQITLLTGKQMPNGVPVCAVFRY